jgi:hypothetical protein
MNEIKGRQNPFSGHPSNCKLYEREHFDEDFGVVF